MPGWWGGRRIRSSAPRDTQMRRLRGPVQSAARRSSSSTQLAMLAPQSQAIQTITSSTPPPRSPQRRCSVEKASRSVSRLTAVSVPQVGWRPRGPATGRSVSRGEAEQYDRGEQQRRDDHVQESGRSQVQKSHRLARSAVRFARTGSLSQMPSGWAPVVPYQQSPRDRLRQRGFQRPCRQDRRMIGASRSARPRRRSFPSATAAAIVENPVYDSSIV
jgi:hypothetical protein